MINTNAEIAAVSAVASLSMPSYALDGRPISWNANHTACVFRSTSAEYHSDKNAVSSSMLKQLVRSPAHLQAYLRKPNTSTPAQRFGTAVHTAVLETHLFRQEYVIYPHGDRRGSKWTDFQASNAGKSILKPEELQQVVGAARSVLEHKITEIDGSPYRVCDLKAAGKSEINFYWLDEETGLTCKARYDLIAGAATFDLKTTDDARPAAFSRQCATLGYDIQAAFYLRGRIAFNPTMAGRAKFYFLAVEANAPHPTLLHYADPDEFVHFGNRKVSELLRTYKACRDANQWPAYATPTTGLKLPLRSRYSTPDLDI